MTNRGMYHCVAAALAVAALFVPGSVFADVLPLDTATPGVLASAGSIDYTIELSAPGALTVTLEGWRSTYNWSMDIDRMYLYNADGDPAGWTSGFGSEEDPYFAHMMETNDSYTINAGMAGTYTLRLHSGVPYQWPEGVTGQSYTVTVTLDEVDDANEDNGSMETATAIAVGQALTACQWRPVPTMHVSDDEDYYRIDLPSPGILTITLYDWVSTFNWSANYDHLSIYTAEGVRFNADGNDDIYSWMMVSTAADSGVVTINLASGGTYYIRLHAGNGIQTEPYTMRCDFQAIGDEQEQNDELATAAPLQSGVTASAYQWRSLAQGPVIRGDEDWYSFTVADSGAVSLAVTGWVSTYSWSADYDMFYLYRTDGRPEPEQISSQHMIGGSFTRDFQLAAGTYAIRLHSGRGTSTEPYTILLTYPDVPSAVADGEMAAFRLDQPYPNPFNPETTISYSLSEQASVTVAVYDIMGRRVRTLVDGIRTAGGHRTMWDGTGDGGRSLAAGVYFIRLTGGHLSDVRKVVMVK